MIKHFTPDISWRDYVPWLQRRRPDLNVVHMEQPHDWVELIAGLAEPHSHIIETMAERARNEFHHQLREVIVLGFSLGGLSALTLAQEIATKMPDVEPYYLALITFGTPYKGTGRLLDLVIRHMQQDYFHNMFDVDETKSRMRQLVQYGSGHDLRILLGEIERDEMVSASSSLLPVHWLTNWDLPIHLKWGTFSIQCSEWFRAHDGLLHDPVALAYIDGLIDGLLHAENEPAEYQPFNIAE